MRVRSTFLAASVALGITSASAFKEAPPNPDAFQSWREDLLQIDRELRRRHPNLFHSTDSTAYVTLRDELLSELSRLPPHVIIVRAAQWIASIGDAHTYLDFPTEGPFAFRQYPIAFEWLNNDLVVTGASADESQYLGSRVIRFDGTSVDSVLSLTQSIVSADNEMTVRFLTPRRITIPEVLQALGVSSSQNRLALLLEAPDGRVAELRIAPEDRHVQLTSLGDRDDAPLYLRYRERPFWMGMLENSATLYVQINSSSDSDTETLAGFAEELRQALDQGRSSRLVVDLRHNIGGNSRLTLPILHAIIGSEQVNKPGHLFVLIGRATISAATVFATQLRQHTHAIFVGEPTGSAPNQYGDNLFLTLEHSRVRVSYATQYFQTAGPYERDRWIAPDVFAEPTIEDLRSGRDAVLEAALTFEPPLSLRLQLQRAYDESGFAAAEDRYRDFTTTARNRFVDTERDVRLFCRWLRDGGNVDDAVEACSWNLQAYPSRTRSYLELADALAVAGALDSARAAIITSLELLEQDNSLHRALRFQLEEAAQTRLQELHR